MSKNLVAEMMLENTGAHFLDSGGAYGRHHERNQERDFECECATSLTFKWDYPEVTHNIYHWLKERIEPADDMQALFDEMVDESDPDEYWLSLMERFPKWLREVKNFDVNNHGSYNTYNGECLLSQVLQFHYFEADTGAGWGGFYLLQIHGGADVRGGYTAPKVFEETDEHALLDNARAYIQCTRTDIDPNQLEFEGLERDKSPHYWFTDDGCHWYFEGSAGMNAGQQLETFEISDDIEDKGQGAIYRDDDGNGFCPHCGSSLYASS